MQKLFLTIFLASLAIIFSGKTALAAEAAPFQFTLGDQTFAVSQAELENWKGPQVMTEANIFGGKPEAVKNSLLKFVGQESGLVNYPKTYNHKLAPIYNYIQQLASSTINIPVVEPMLKIENNTVVEFAPPQTGQQTDVYKSAMDTLEALQKNNSEIALTVNEQRPKQSLAETNDLGINELVASGVSSFAGSPKNRRHNIKVGVEKFKGLIIQKGEEFSFNKYLGPVEAENGFLPELVIKKTGTVPELGGGLCQVSSTTFRAAMNAGLPITERRNHAYAVQYYSPQGTDATIYPGIVDLKFINDTPGVILVWPHLEAKDTLIFDFYGTKDSRQIILGKPSVYDRHEDGSMKATWTREVVSARGEKRSDIFKSVYQSPALFHKTEEFVTAAAPPGLPPPTLAPPTGVN